MFTQSCFVKSIDPSLIQELERIGYTRSECCNPNGDSIVTNSNFGRYTIINSALFYDKDPRVTWDYNRIDCKDNEELFLAIAALRDDTDYMQWFMIPHTKTVPIPGYCGQQGMNGYQRIITSVEYHKYDRKDNHISDLIKFEKEDGETILPRKLNIEELKLWFIHKIMHNPYKDDPNIKCYTNNIRE